MSSGAALGLGAAAVAIPAIAAAIQGDIKPAIGTAIGAGLGAVIGSAFPGIGTALGALLGGGLGGIFGGFFQHGGSFIVNQPTLLGVGEAGAEHVAITPLTGGRGAFGGSGGDQIINLSLNMNSPVLDDINMLRFGRTVAAEVRKQQRRVV